MRKILLMSASILLFACKAPATTSAEPSMATAAPSSQVMAMPTESPPITKPSASATPAFVDKVWEVSSSSAIEAGSTYTFLSGGQLVTDSPNGTPMHGKWTYEKGVLSIIEEGLSYTVEIVKLDANIFQIRAHDPGGAVEINLVSAPEVSLPVAK